VQQITPAMNENFNLDVRVLTQPPERIQQKNRRTISGSSMADK
jgi:hypothetical protein